MDFGNANMKMESLCSDSVIQFCVVEVEWKCKFRNKKS